MRRVSLLALAALIPFTTMASAQTSAPLKTLDLVLAEAKTALVNPDIVVTRLMTFDRDSDGRLVLSELPERMQSVLAGDTSGDQALDRDEIRAIARPARPAAFAATVPGFRGGGGGGYTFGDQVSLSTRPHVEGALDDLRLTPIAHQQALAIVRPFMDRLEADAQADLVRELEGLMSPNQLDSFTVMLERHLTGKNMPRQIITRADGSNVRVNVFRFFGPDLAQMINGFALPPDQTKAALTAFEGFKARIRPADADRAALLDELKDVLNDEERENFGAALQRRPLVKANAMFAGVVGGVAGGIVPPPPPPLPALPGDVVSPSIVRPLKVLEP